MYRLENLQVHLLISVCVFKDTRRNHINYEIFELPKRLRTLQLVIVISNLVKPVSVSFGTTGQIQLLSKVGGSHQTYHN